MTAPLVEHQARGRTVHVSLTLFERPHPYTRWRTARAPEYQAWRSRIRDIARAALLEAKVPAFGKGEILGACFAFGATASSPATARRRKDGKPDQRTVTSIGDYDLSNLIKGLEDAMNGVLWHDDAQVRFYGPCYAVCTHVDYLAVHAWSAPGGKPWSEAMEPLTVWWHAEERKAANDA